MKKKLVEIANDLKEKIHSILLVDWPSRDIPLMLLQSGYAVFSYSPDGYSQALMESNLPADPTGIKESVSVTGTTKDGLVFQPLGSPPVAVDLVMIFRPPEEHEAIIRDLVLPLRAKVLWLQSPVESMETGKMAIDQGLTFVQGRDIREICR